MAYSAVSASKPFEAHPERASDQPAQKRQMAKRPEGPNGARALQAMAEAAMLEMQEDSHRWTPRAGLAVSGGVSLFLWALLGVIVF